MVVSGIRPQGHPNTATVRSRCLGNSTLNASALSLSLSLSLEVDSVLYGNGEGANGSGRPRHPRSAPLKKGASQFLGLVWKFSPVCRVRRKRK